VALSTSIRWPISPFASLERATRPDEFKLEDAQENLVVSRNSGICGHISTSLTHFESMHRNLSDLIFNLAGPAVAGQVANFVARLTPDNL
jgi:hypothetical protein